jgi:hypothetical protein
MTLFLFAALMALLLVNSANAQTAAPSPAPALCFICGEGNEVTAPGGVVDLGGDTITCGELDLAGSMGFIPADFCPIIQQVSCF